MAKKGSKVICNLTHNANFQNKSSNKIYACTFEGCKSVFNRPYRLAQHQLVHVNMRPFKCQAENCQKAYSSKSHLDRHFKTSHKQQEDAREIIYCCPICVKSYVNRQNLKRHMKVHHSGNSALFICDICKTMFKKKHQLRSHMFQHTGVKSFRCLLCSRDFQSHYDRRKHMRNHKTYKCEHCSTLFHIWAHLVAHKRTNHKSDVSEYICNECGEVYNKRKDIVQHVKRHLPNNSQIPVFYCTYENCLRHYSRNSNLKQHILVKHEGFTFDCSLCSARLSTKARLKEHISRHLRTEVTPKPPKTLEDGRKKRKDENSVKIASAVKLAGLVKVEMDNSSDSPHNVDLDDLNISYFHNSSFSDMKQPNKIIK